MKTTTVKKLTDMFVGKICTILTNTVGKTNFTDIQFSEFFTGYVESIDEDGVVIRHHTTNCKTFYALSHIVGILEEQVITDDNPLYEKVVEEVKKSPPEKKPMEIPPMENKTPFIDPALMAALSKQAAITTNKMIQKNQP